MTGLDYEIVPIRLDGGFAEKLDPKAAPDDSGTEVVNGEYTKLGEVRPRLGYAAESMTSLTQALGGGSIGTLKRLTSLGTSQVLIDEDTIYSKSGSLWAARDRAGTAVVTKLSIANDAKRTMLEPTVVVYGSLVYTAWLGDDDFVYYSVVDESTGVTHIPATQLSLSTNLCTAPKAVLTGSTVHTVWQDTTDSKLVTRRYSLLAPATSPVTQQEIQTSYNGGTNFDVCNADGTAWVVAWKNSTDIKMQRFDATATSTHTRTISSVNPGAISLASDATDDLYLVYQDTSGNTLEAEVCDVTDLTNAAGPTTVSSDAYLSAALISTGVVAADASTACIVWSNYVSGTLNDYTRWVDFDNSGSVGSTEQVVIGFTAVSKPAVYSGRVYCLVRAGHEPSDSSAGYALADLNFGNIATAHFKFTEVAFMANGRGEERSTNSLGNLFSDGTSLYSAQAYTRDLGDGISGQSPTAGIAVWRMDFGRSDDVLDSRYGEYVCFGGGVPKVFDGENLVSIGFFSPPRIASVAGNVGSGSLSSGEQYRYVSIYEYFDRFGNKYRSLPSTLTSASLETLAGSENECVVSIRWHQPFSKSDYFNQTVKSVVVKTYRSEDSRIAGPFYLVDATELDRDASSGSITVTDGTADSGILDNEACYFPSEVASDRPPPGVIVAEHGQRLMIASSEEPHVVYYSKRMLPGFGPEFNLGFRIDTYDQSGDVTGIASSDELLVIFKRRKIYVVTGDGPDASGFPVDGYSAPREISSSIGCSDHRSVVQTPLGVFFRSDEGFYLLDRSTSLQYVGSDIVDTAAAYPTTLRAVLVRAKSQVRWLLSDGDESIVLVYDWLRRQWSRFDVTLSDMTDMAEFGDDVYIAAGDTIYKESGREDNSNSITMTTVTPWVKFGAVDGYKRVQRFSIIGTMFDETAAAALSITFFYNHDETDSDTLSYSAAELNSYLSGYTLQVTGVVPRQRVRAIKAEVSVQLNDTPGIGLTAVTYKVGGKRGIFKQALAEYTAS